MTDPSRKAHEPESIQVARDRLLFILKYMDAIDPESGTQAWITIVESTFAERDSRKMRLLNREVQGRSTALTREQKHRLALLMQERFGAEALSASNASSIRAAAILQRGRILSEIERQWLESHVETLQAGGESPAQVEQIRSLLTSSDT